MLGASLLRPATWALPEEGKGPLEPFPEIFRAWPLHLDSGFPWPQCWPDARGS